LLAGGPKEVIMTVETADGRARRASTDAGFAIRSEGLTKRFGSRLAVDGIDLRVPAGVVCGFVGPNGAGKTTTIRLLLGLVRATSGTGAVLGQSLDSPAAYLSRVGALIEGPAFYPTLTGRANLAVLARLGGLSSDGIPGMLDRVGLAGRGDDLFRSYSLGMKQRLGVAAALLCEPELLVLDEPANGLDPAGILETRHLLRALADDGITIFVSSHLLGEVEQICDHLVMIRSGRLVFQGGIDDLFAAQAAELIARPERAADLATLEALVVRTGHRARVEGDTLRVVAAAAWAADLNRMAASAGITLVHLSEERPSLEEAFFELTSAESGDVAERQQR
jgi:ABC-2 type transport system ATP-binding protein